MNVLQKNVDKWCDMQIWGYKAEKNLVENIMNFVSAGNI